MITGNPVLTTVLSETVTVAVLVLTTVGAAGVVGVTPSISQLDVQPGTTPGVPPPAPELTAVAPAVNVDGPKIYAYWNVTISPTATDGTRKPKPIV